MNKDKVKDAMRKMIEGYEVIKMLSARYVDADFVLKHFYQQTTTSQRIKRQKQ